MKDTRGVDHSQEALRREFISRDNHIGMVRTVVIDVDHGVLE